MNNYVGVNRMLLTMTDAGSMCGCSYSTIQKLVRNKRIPALRRGKAYLISVDDLNAYIKSLIVNV